MVWSETQLRLNHYALDCVKCNRKLTPTIETHKDTPSNWITLSKSRPKSLPFFAAKSFPLFMPMDHLLNHLGRPPNLAPLRLTHSARALNETRHSLQSSRKTSHSTTGDVTQLQPHDPKVVPTSLTHPTFPSPMSRRNSLSSRTSTCTLFSSRPYSPTKAENSYAFTKPTRMLKPFSPP